MSTTGFHSEWITIEEHRILLDCRASFPDENMRFLARVAVEACRASKEARVVHINYDDKSCFWTIRLASTREKDKEIAERLQSALHTLRQDGNCQVQMNIVAKGNESSDHYNHTEHLSVASEVAVDRWKHQDPEYTKTIQPPR